MAFLGITTPYETARLLAGIDVPGVPVPAHESHITMAYLGKDVPLLTIQKAIAALSGVMATARPFTVRTSLVTTFPRGEDGVPVICKIESPELLELRARVVAAFDAMGVEYSKRFAYNPHVTLAYSETEFADVRIPTVEWGVTEIVLWGGDQGDDKLTVNFPMKLTLEERVAFRFRSAE